MIIVNNGERLGVKCASFKTLRYSQIMTTYEVYLISFNYTVMKHFIISEHTENDLNGNEEGYYPNGSPYRIQRHAANIRERKRMLR